MRSHYRPLIFLLVITPCSLLCNKNAQYSPVCHNRSTILRLDMEMSCRLCFVAIPWRYPHLGFLLLMLRYYVHQTRRHVVHHKFFSDIVPMSVIKYSYDAGKFSTKVMTIFSSLMHISKQTSWYASPLILLTWSNRLLPSCILYVKTCGECKGCWINFWSCKSYKGSFTPSLVLCNSWCVQICCPPSWDRW